MILLRYAKRARDAAKAAEQSAAGYPERTEARRAAEYHAAEAAAQAEKAGLLLRHRSAAMAERLIPAYAERAETAALQAYKAADIVQAYRERGVIHR